MQAKPFMNVKNGSIFRDIDGNALIKTPKSATSSEGVFTNCVVIMSNSSDLKRGDLTKKGRDIYCEVIDPAETVELKGDEEFRTDEEKEEVTISDN